MDGGIPPSHLFEVHMPAEIQDDSYYVVKLKKAVKDGNHWLRPKDRVVLRGSKLKELKDFVVSYELK
jgi:hypothetical protein